MARTSRKLDWKRIGRIPIKKGISLYAHELVLPVTVKLHPIFHVSLLDPTPLNPVVRQHLPSPRTGIIDDKEE